MKKTKFSLIFTALIFAFAFVFSACGSFNGGYNRGDYNTSIWNGNDNYKYEEIEEKPFYSVSEKPTSYFSLDRNTASYSLVRRQINNNRAVSPTSVRTEEIINYFDYGYPAPTDGKAIALNGYLTDCPWNDGNKLLTFGIKTAVVNTEAVKNNYVFLIDVSGSMYGADRLDLVKYGLNKLTDGLNANDRVSIVTYASGVELKLESTVCDESGKTSIKNAVNSLDANGATNGSGGLELAYTVAERGKATDVNSRVIMMSDGDFNVGKVGKQELTEYIQEKAKGGVYLSVLGFGMGNTRDDILEKLALNGNGNYAYIDCETEAEKVLNDELDGMLVTVAKDAKAGVTFSDAVIRYRLIGYDTKYITEDDFNNAEKDAGEIGSNLTVTAMYEIEIDQTAEEGAKLASSEIRYKDARNDDINESVTAEIDFTFTESENIKFAACAAEFGLLLRQSKYKGTANFKNVLTRLEDLKHYTDGDVYKKEFASLVAKASEYM